jgi:hypothetical protein
MSHENVELHRRANEAFNTRDVEAYLAFCDPDIELRSAVTGPGPAVYYRHSGVRRWHRDLTEAFGGDVRLEPEAFFDLGEHTVTFHVLHGRGLQSGANVQTLPPTSAGGATGGSSTSRDTSTDRTPCASWACPSTPWSPSPRDRQCA